MRRASFDSLFNEWQLFVNHVQRGYDDIIYDYENDLSVRDMLEERLKDTSVLPDKMQRLRRLDDAFIEAAIPASEPGEKPWHGRVPKNPGPEVGADLENRS